MTIVITGVGGFRNRGVEAFTIPTVERLLEQFPGEEIAVLTPTPDYDSLRLQSPGVTLMRNDFSLGGGSPRMQQLRRSAARLLGRRPRSEGNAANRLIRSAKMVVALGGDTFSSDYGQLYRHLEPLAYAQQHEVPVVFLAHSIGPFRTPAEAEAWSRVARKSALVTVRESLTYEYLIDTLAIHRPSIHLTADPAFLLSPPPSEISDATLRGYGLDPSRPRIALAISQAIGGWGNVDERAHLGAWIEAINSLLGSTDADLLLVPHVQGQNTSSDDRIIATELLKRLRWNPRLRLMGGDHSAAEFKGLIGSCDLVIAERMHAAIAGLSSGVCTLVVGYSVKAKGILSDLLADAELRQDLLFPVQELIDPHKFAAAAINAWMHRQMIAQSLAQVIPESRARAEDNYRLLGTLLLA